MTPTTRGFTSPVLWMSGTTRKTKSREEVGDDHRGCAPTVELFSEFDIPFPDSMTARDSSFNTGEWAI